MTWSGGTADTKVIGVVSEQNSLVGSAPGDQVGWSITPLVNGNYVVASQYWNGNRGAVTWGSGTAGVTGPVSASNSLVGSMPEDRVGLGITALPNGNYVVASPFWTNNTGATTWVDGATGRTNDSQNIISGQNSLVGAAPGDQVGTYGVTALTNGNYVVLNPASATWVNGATGTTGASADQNSLVGTSAGSMVIPLANGNYVVASPFWTNNTGAATWVNGATGQTSDGQNTISSDNSLIGSVSGDKVGAGYGSEPGVRALDDGNYLVVSHYWNNYTGAVTWGNGAAGTVGAVSAGNSVVGSSPNSMLKEVTATGANGLFFGAYADGLHVA